MEWQIVFYSNLLEQELLALPEETLAKLLRYLDRMLIYGPDLGMPHTRAMGSGLFELRIKSKTRNERVFYCTLSGKQIVFLHHFSKKSQKTPVRILDIAKTRMKEVKNARLH
jgi:phage-related protein